MAVLTGIVCLLAGWQPPATPPQSPIRPSEETVERMRGRGTTALESEVPDYRLPPLPRRADGTPDREAIVRTLREEMFGVVPDNLRVGVEAGPEETRDLGDGLTATARVFTITATGPAGNVTFRPVLFRPASGDSAGSKRREGPKPYGCFVMLDHRGDARPKAGWVPEPETYWDVRQIIAAGMATVCVPIETVAPNDRRPVPDAGIFAISGQPADPQWSTLAAWAWAMSETRKAVQAQAEIGPCYAIGHSRGGKTALWAAATDSEFVGVVSNNSGCGGAALSRRRLGETVEIITRVFPAWFNTRFREYAGREDALPFDQHWLVAASHPRGVAVGSAADDVWADPWGEWLSLKAAAAAWGRDLTWPRDGGRSVDTGPLHYHLREGGHALTAEDWGHYIRWAERVRGLSIGDGE